ncbi:NAD-dependent epimerase/dehydratase family protein [Occultella kanbiaonis]|uniref:NAD-dependent epimerase/dehydratase family protein n=1 Tax=Occultella kanbiaonis TaxID=2675754 RepID=UPI0012B9B313|nr:NAD-dependent epimerase/dehydratase family protein [Occultella kanbiaonis]
MTSVLFIGGNGQISASCVDLALSRGMAVTVLNRGTTHTRTLPDGVEVLHADAHDVAALGEALAGREFDAVAQFRSFKPEHAAADVEFFTGRTGQFVYISSASAYQTPPAVLPVTEQTPLENPYWQYSRDKAASEELLFAAHADRGFPVTVVRPSATYDRTRVPTSGGWTDAARMLRGAPVAVVGDGTTRWTLTHARDFAVGFVGLLGRADAVGEAFHITSDFAPTWNEIFTVLSETLDVEANLLHVPATEMAAVDADFGAGMLGDKANSFVLDNSKIRGFVPEFAPSTTVEQGFAESVAWHLEQGFGPVGDPKLEAMFDQIVARH